MVTREKTTPTVRTWAARHVTLEPALVTEDIPLECPVFGLHTHIRRPLVRPAPWGLGRVLYSLPKTVTRIYVDLVATDLQDAHKRASLGDNLRVRQRR